MENTLVLCKTKAQVREVLAKAKKIGYRVHDDYVDSFWHDYRSETVINLNSNGQSVTYSDKDWYEKRYSEKIISAIEFLGFKPILITRKGRVVTAENKNTGEKAIATCSPDDEFDFGTGAMIAVARLIAQSDKGITKDAETVLRPLLGYNTDTSADKHKAKVGDKLIIREWDEMRDNEDRDSVGNIFSRNDPQGCFSTAMKSISGKTVVITELDEEDEDRFRIVPSGFPNAKKWWVRRWMVKEFITDDSPADAPTEEEPTAKFKIGDIVTLKDGLEVGKSYGAVDLLEIMYSNGYGKPMRVTDTAKCEDGDMAYDCAPIGGGRSFWYVEEMLEPWDENKIHEGDIVKVINTGLNYSTYPQWVGEHISDPDMAARYCFGSPGNGGDYKVIKIAEHESNGRTLAYIEQCEGFVFNKCYLVEVKGLEKVTE